MSEKKKSKEIEVVNRRAQFEYRFVDTYEAGIMLTGTEVKSVRKGGVDLRDAYCLFKDGELEIRNMLIAEYSHGNYSNHETRRTRKLLLKRSELKKLERRVKEKGFTIVPYRVYFSDRNMVKLEITLAQGKQAFDKRESIKEKDNKRELDRMKKLK